MYVTGLNWTLPPLGSDAVVSSFVFLGSTITNNGDLKPDRPDKAMQLLWTPLWHHHSVSCKTKQHIYNAMVLPVLYGAESWALKN